MKENEVNLPNFPNINVKNNREAKSNELLSKAVEAVHTVASYIGGYESTKANLLYTLSYELGAIMNNDYQSLLQHSEEMTANVNQIVNSQEKTGRR